MFDVVTCYASIEFIFAIMYHVFVRLSTNLILDDLKLCTCSCTCSHNDLAFEVIHHFITYVPVVAMLRFDLLGDIQAQFGASMRTREPRSMTTSV